jgi:uncharacterized MAPEG superfamily protein
MSIALWCVVIAALLPFVSVGIAKASGARYDNADPRRWLEQQQGLTRRADQAHRNHFEAFPLIAFAVLLGIVRHMNPVMLDMLAGFYIVVRLLYTAVYLANWSTLRSAIWVTGLILALAILVMAGFTPATGLV